MVLKLLCTAFSIAALTWPRLVLGVDQTRDPGLVAKLKTAATANDRRTLLPNDSDWLYDFTVSCLGRLEFFLTQMKAETRLLYLCTRRGHQRQRCHLPCHCWQRND